MSSEPAPRSASLVARSACENGRGWPEVYNSRGTAADTAKYALFVHDAWRANDSFLADRVVDGLGRYDSIGVAGNGRRLPCQPK